MALEQYAAQQQRLLADPKIQAVMARVHASGRGGPFGAVLDPREFGITDLPRNIKFDPRAGKLIDNSINGMEWLPVVAGAALLTYGVPAALTSGPETLGPSTAANMSATATGTGPAAPGMLAADTAGNVASATTAGGSILSTLTKPSTIAKIAGIGMAAKTAFSGDGNPNGNPFGDSSDLMAQVKKSLALQQQRQEQAQPVYDSIVNMAYGRMPQRYRGAPPSGYPAGANDAPEGAYAYQAPRFT